MKLSLIALAAGTALTSSTLAAGPEHAQHAEDATGAQTHGATLADLVELPPEPALWIGAQAPELKIAEFIKGEDVDGFEDGQVYVVEFWATWCGPCIAMFPHLSELQEHYGDKVTIVGVNIWERAEGQARLELVENFVEKEGDRMGYTVALERGTEMADTWMKPAGQGGIPAAFIVDGTGHIAWIGHPGGIDEPLETVAGGDYNLEQLAEQTREDALVMAGLNAFASGFRGAGDLEKSRTIAQILVNDHIDEQPDFLNAVAWMMLSSEVPGVGMDDHRFALKCAALACEQTDWEDWSKLDTYAMAMDMTGDPNTALAMQKKAVELAENDPEAGEKVIAELKARLAEYEEN